MISWLSENMGTIFVGLILAVILILIIKKIIKDRKNGSSCSCGCSGCSMQNVCHKKDE